MLPKKLSLGLLGCLRSNAFDYFLRKNARKGVFQYMKYDAAVVEQF